MMKSLPINLIFIIFLSIISRFSINCDIIMQKRWAFLNITVATNTTPSQIKNIMLTDSALYGLNSPVFSVSGQIILVKSQADMNMQDSANNGTSAEYNSNEGSTNSRDIFTANGCSRYLNTNLPEKGGFIALVSRGECPFETKIQIATEHKAVGIIIYNTDEDVFTMLTRSKLFA